MENYLYIRILSLWNKKNTPKKYFFNLKLITKIIYTNILLKRIPITVYSGLNTQLKL